MREELRFLGIFVLRFLMDRPRGPVLCQRPFSYPIDMSYSALIYYLNDSCNLSFVWTTSDVHQSADLNQLPAGECYVDLIGHCEGIESVNERVIECEGWPLVMMNSTQDRGQLWRCAFFVEQRFWLGEKRAWIIWLQTWKKGRWCNLSRSWADLRDWVLSKSTGIGRSNDLNVGSWCATASMPDSSILKLSRTTWHSRCTAMFFSMATQPTILATLLFWQFLFPSLSINHQASILRIGVSDRFISWHHLHAVDASSVSW